MKLRHKIVCPYCGWSTKEHVYATDCVKEKESAHRNEYSAYAAHDMAFSDICPICGEDMGRDSLKMFLEEE